MLCRVLLLLIVTAIPQGVFGQVSVSPLFGNGDDLLLNEKTLKNKLVMFFKTDCSSCRAQVKDLNCLRSDQVIFLGFSSHLPLLQKEARLMGLEKNVFYADPEVTKSFGLDKDYSPVLFAFNNSGKSKSWLGKQNCKVFVSHLAEGKTRD